MIYQQQTVVADAPAMKETTAAAHGSSSFFSWHPAVEETADSVAAVTAAALSGSCFCSAAAVAITVSADSVGSANSFFLKKEVSHLCGTFSLLFSFLLLLRATAFQALKIYFINSRFVLNVFTLFLFLAIFLHELSPFRLYFIL